MLKQKLDVLCSKEQKSASHPCRRNHVVDMLTYEYCSSFCGGLERSINTSSAMGIRRWVKISALRIFYQQNNFGQFNACCNASLAARGLRFLWLTCISFLLHEFLHSFHISPALITRYQNFGCFVGASQPRDPGGRGTRHLTINSSHSLKV